MCWRVGLRVSAFKRATTTSHKKPLIERATARTEVSG